MRRAPASVAGVLSLALSCLPVAGTAQISHAEVLWEKGGADPPADAVWKRISDAAIFDGRIVAADIDLSEVRVFGVDGRYAKTLGSRGEGPGEFARPISVSVVDDGVLIWDVALARAVRYDAGLQHLASLRVAPPGVSVLQELWEGPRGWWVAQTPLVGRRDSAQSISDHSVLAWRESGMVDTLAVFAGNPFWIYPRFQVGPVMHSVETIGPSGGVSMAGDSLVVILDGLRSELRVFRMSDGGPVEVRHVELPGEPTVVSREDRVAARDFYFGKYSVDPEQTSIRRIEIGDRFPAWTEVIGDRDGVVWVRRGGPEVLQPLGTETWMRVDLSTGSSKELELPPGVRAHDFEGGFVVGSKTDEWGIQSLVLMEVLMDGSPKGPRDGMGSAHP